MLNYILQNKEWIFSGVGVSIISFFLVKNSIKNKMFQKSGKNSTNIQIGGDFTSNVENKNNGNK